MGEIVKFISLKGIFSTFDLGKGLVSKRRQAITDVTMMTNVCDAPRRH